MKIKHLIITICAMLCTCLVSFAQTNQIDEFEKEIKAKNADVKTIDCAFKQTRFVSVLTNSVTQKGHFYFTQPGNILLQFDNGDFIKLTTKWFEMKTAGNITKTKVSSNPMLRNLNSILGACIIGDFSEMKKNFKIELQPSTNEWEVIMKPKKGKAAAKISSIKIVFERKKMSLNTLMMEEKSGDYTKYDFYDKKFNSVLDNELFELSK